MLKKLDYLNQYIGKTPCVNLGVNPINLFAKLEFYNLMGSVKMRPAYYVIKEAIKNGNINENTTVIESSSGNFAIALATICKFLKIKFVPIIDMNISQTYEKLLRTISHDVIKVTERDETGGYLLTRINEIKRFQTNNDNVFWTNQYGNIDCLRAHYYGLGSEISESFDKLDYAFIGVSSCGTIAGVSRKLKEKFPAIKIIAVDTEGSVIFGKPPGKRYIPGIGSSMTPDILKEALIDEVIYVPEAEAVKGCYELFEKFVIFAGGSSGASYYAIGEYFKGKKLNQVPNVVFLCPDGGSPYVDTVYNNEWVKWINNQKDSVMNL